MKSPFDGSYMSHIPPARISLLNQVYAPVPLFTPPAAKKWEDASRIINGEVPLMVTEIVLNRRYSFSIDGHDFSVQITGGNSSSIHIAMSEGGPKGNSAFREIPSELLISESLGSLFKRYLPSMLTEIVVILSLEGD